MRILIITSLYPDDSPIQTTNAVHDLVRFWTDEHEVICFKGEWRCISFDPSKSSFNKDNWLHELKLLFGYKYCEKDKVRIYRFTCLSNPLAKLKIQIFEKFFTSIMAFKIKGMLAKLRYNPDIIISHMPSQSIIYYIGSLKVNCPKIAVMHKTDVLQLNDVKENARLLEEKINLINHAFDAVFARSHSIYKKLAEIGRIENLQKDIISSGVPQCENYCEKQWDNWEIRKKTILYVGRLIPLKGVDIVLNCLSLVRNDSQFTYYIVGEGEEHEKLEQLCKQLDMEDIVKMVGNVSRKEVYDYMKKADIFVMPSHPETLGLVYLEAMANGCITIGSKDEGIDGIIVDGENGFLVNALDAEDLTKCFKHIFCMSEEQLQRVSRNAKMTADWYTQEERSQIYLEKVIEQIDMYKTEQI